MAARDNQNLSIKAGDTFRMRILILDDTNAPAVLANPVGTWSLAAQATITTAAPILVKTSASGVTFTTESVNNQSTWVCYITFTAADTVNLAPGKHYHQLKIVDGTNSVTVMTGIMEIGAVL